MALTKRDVDRIAYDPDGPTIQMHADGDVPGLYVRVYPSGKKSFVLRYRPTGASSPKNLTLGAYGNVYTIQQARRRARDELLRIKTGSDPAEQRRQALRGNSVRDFATLFMDRHGKQKRERTREEYQRMLNLHILPAIGAKKLTEVQRTDIARLQARLADRPIVANRTIEVVRLMFNKAVEWGELPEATRNPAVGLKPFGEKERDRWVKPDELPRLISAIEQEPNIYARAAIKMLLLTGCRKNEVLRLQWKDVDFRRAEIRLRETKTEARTVPLSSEALDLLREMPEGIGDGYVFPSTIKSGQPMVNLTKAWGRIRKQAGLEDVTIHDLRRTAGSLMASSGVSAAIVGKVLGHSSPAATKIYARIGDDAARKALQEHGTRIGPLLTRQRA